MYPALAIAEKFREKDPDGKIIYAGYPGGFEHGVVPKYGYEMVDIDTRWFERGSVKELSKFTWHVLNGIRQARKFLKEFKPDLIIGTGGFVCFPVIFAGKKLGIKCYVHEQNAFPGLSNRTLEKYVRKIFLGFKEGGEYFSDKRSHCKYKLQSSREHALPMDNLSCPALQAGSRKTCFPL